MTRIAASTSTALPEKHSRCLTNAVVVATADGLTLLPERIRRRLANRWGFVEGAISGTKEVLVYYPVDGSDPRQVEMVVPFPAGENAVEFVRDATAVAAWRAQVLACSEKRRQKLGRPRRG
jgi:hypothetical protein